MRLVEYLKERKLLTEDDIKNLKIISNYDNKSLIENILNIKKEKSKEILKAIAEYLNIPFCEINNYYIDPQIINIIPKKMAIKYKVIPLFLVEDRLTLAVSDPFNILVIDEIKQHTKVKHIDIVLASKNDILNAINEYYGGKDNIEELVKEISKKDVKKSTRKMGYTLDKEISTTVIFNKEDIPEELKKSPVIKLVNHVISEAIRKNSSDIHIEPFYKKTRIRYRIDGVLHLQYELPSNIHPLIISRIKILAGMDIAEKRAAQDGNIHFDYQGEMYDIRVSCIPTVYNEKVVLRILPKGENIYEFKKLGFLEEDIKILQQVLEYPDGIVLVTGPTGSGKSTTLYSILNRLNTMDRNIITIEDPVEKRLDGINQIQINVKTGITFAKGLRAILRQDPDIIMIGEIRDRETAEIAIQSALTGHLVLSTLHTNNVFATISRLLEMGIESYLISAALRLIIAQRLVRRTCQYCAQEREIPQEYLPIFEKIAKKYNLEVKNLEGQGCKHCFYIGYRGRISISELLPVNEDIQNMISKNVDISEIKRIAKTKYKFKTMAEDAIIKVLQGKTSFSEIKKYINIHDYIKEFENVSYERYHSE